MFAGICAEKFLANNEPERSRGLADTPENKRGLKQMGYRHNRYRLEQMIEHSGIDTLIVRLPVLYVIIDAGDPHYNVNLHHKYGAIMHD